MQLFKKKKKKDSSPSSTVGSGLLDSLRGDYAGLLLHCLSQRHVTSAEYAFECWWGHMLVLGGPTWDQCRAGILALLIPQVRHCASSEGPPFLSLSPAWSQGLMRVIERVRAECGVCVRSELQQFFFCVQRAPLTPDQVLVKGKIRRE